MKIISQEKEYDLSEQKEYIFERKSGGMYWSYCLQLGAIVQVETGWPFCKKQRQYAAVVAESEWFCDMSPNFKRNFIMTEEKMRQLVEDFDQAQAALTGNTETRRVSSVGVGVSREALKAIEALRP